MAAGAVVGPILAGTEDDDSWVHVVAGPFWRGSDGEEREFAYRIGGAAARRYRWFDIEVPRRQEVLAPFTIARFLVSNAEYQAFVDATGHRPPGIGEAEYREQGYLAHPYREVVPYLWRERRHPPGRERHPVVLVSREDAQAYARWRGARDGRRYRLPREVEWEKAARGTDGRYFPWGNRWDPARANTGYRFGGTTAVDAFPSGASPYGCLDMCGNVFEWTASSFADGKAVMKGGGSWDDEPGICRAAARHGRAAGARHILFGFRLVWEGRGG